MEYIAYYLHSSILSTGNTKLAIECYEESLNMIRKLFGLHPTLATVYNNLGDAYRVTNDLDNAAQYLRRSLAIERMFIAHNTNTTAVSLVNNARVILQSGGNLTRALYLLDEAYDIRVHVGLKHFTTAMIHTHRGSVQLSLEQFGRAAESFDNAVTILQQLEKGTRPRQMAKALQLWGVALKNLGSLEQAEQRLTMSLKISKKVAKDNDTPCEKEDGVKDALRELGEVKSMMGMRN